MRTKTTKLDWREGRRQRAWELKQHGWKQQDIAAALRVTPGTVSHWLKRGRKRGREQGVEGLRRHPAPGQPPRLTPELNPDEGIGTDLTRVERAKVCYSDLTALVLAVRRAKERLRHKRAVIQACFRQAGYQV